MRRVTKDEIYSAVRGICNIESDGDSFRFHRFLPENLKAYEAYPIWLEMAAFSAGVTLDFLTDSPFFKITAEIEDGKISSTYFDLVVDGVFVSSGGAHDCGGLIDVELHSNIESGNLKNAVLYLPYVRPVRIIEIQIAKSAQILPAPEKTVMLALGDSITQGISSYHPAMTFAAVTARESGMTLHNCGVGGYIFNPDSIKEKPVPSPTVIIVAYGTNDWSMDNDVEKAHSYLKSLRKLYPTVPVVVLEPIWRNKSDGVNAQKIPGKITLDEYREKLATIVNRFPDITCIASEDLLPGVSEFYADGTHPTTAGHAVYGMNLAKKLKSIYQ